MLFKVWFRELHYITECPHRSGSVSELLASETGSAVKLDACFGECSPEVKGVSTEQLGVSLEHDKAAETLNTELHQLGFSVVHCGSLWFTVVLCGSLWFTGVLCGSLGFSVVHCGSLWITVVHCGSLW